MSPSAVSIRCRKCRRCFQPDLGSRGLWVCPYCRGKNPNLKRHYRAIADLFFLGLAVVVTVVIVNRKQFGPVGWAVESVQGLLLLVSIVAIYRSTASWADLFVNVLIWIVFSCALLGNVVLPLLLRGQVSVPFLILYALLFPYLFWLNWQAKGMCSDVRPTQPPNSIDENDRIPDTI